MKQINFPKLSKEKLLERLEHPNGIARVIIDTDAANEIDDQFALTWALLSPEKLKIEADIAEDFHFALEGIKKLPSSSKLGVYVAYRYYMSLFKKIKSVPSERLMHERIRVANTKKLYITFKSYCRNQLNWI